MTAPIPVGTPIAVSEYNLITLYRHLRRLADSGRTIHVSITSRDGAERTVTAGLVTVQNVGPWIQLVAQLGSARRQTIDVHSGDLVTVLPDTSIRVMRVYSQDQYTFSLSG